TAPGESSDEGLAHVTLVVGIDPGLAGGVAILTPAGEIECQQLDRGASALPAVERQGLGPRPLR
ncbi:MAG TPA: hypothetical protein VN845_08615, partial [Solirubrobacteraceae bacterium]|nr:hypothetical protein [Solirubrobacteraceae bacterium]